MMNRYQLSTLVAEVLTSGNGIAIKAFESGILPSVDGLDSSTVGLLNITEEAFMLDCNRNSINALD